MITTADVTFCSQAITTVGYVARSLTHDERRLICFTCSYGDLTPRSILGRLFTIPLLVFGLLLIALPSFVLGRNFAIVFDAMQVELFQPVSDSQR